jgi:porin
MSGRNTSWLQFFKRDRSGKHALRAKTVLVTMLSIALTLFAGQLFAQDTNGGASPRSTNPPSLGTGQDGPQSPAQVDSTPPASSTGRYDTATLARLHSMNPKSWGPRGSLAPDFGDILLGDVGGVRSALADYGIAGEVALTATQWQNLLNAPTKTRGSQAYVGQKYTAETADGITATYDLGHIGLEGAQIILDAACSVSNYVPAYGRGCRLLELSFYDSFFRGRVELSAGILPNDEEFVDTYVGGRAESGAFGPLAVLPVQSGLSRQPGVAPGLNVTYNFDSNWYEKIGVQRSESPQGLVAEYSYFNRHGLTFSEHLAKALVIDEVGFRQIATSDEFFTYIRVGGLYNWTRYTDFNTGGASPNWNAYLLGDRQFSRPDSGRPYRGWYGGFSVMESPSNVNVFRNYYEARVYNIGPFKSRPADQANIVATYSLFSRDARHYYIDRGVYPSQKDTASVTLSYTYKAARGTYLTPGLSFTSNPTFIYEPGQGHDLNFFFSFSAHF